jgi:hypothetical protein
MPYTFVARSSCIETGQDLVSCHVVRHALSGRELLLREVDLAESLQLFEEALRLRVSLELGTWLDVLVEP